MAAASAFSRRARLFLLMAELLTAAAARLNAVAAAASARVALPSLALALTVFALFVLLELLQRWAVLRPVRFMRDVQRACVRLLHLGLWALMWRSFLCVLCASVY
jgi:hypothetical protein